MKCATQPKPNSSNFADYIKTQFTFLKLSKYEESFQSKFLRRGGDRGLIILKRNKHLKGGNIYVKQLFAIEIFHLVGAMHSSHFCPEVAAAYILVFFTGRENRLYANNTFTFHLPCSSRAVKDVPVPAMKFYRK